MTKLRAFGPQTIASCETTSPYDSQDTLLIHKISEERKGMDCVLFSLTTALNAARGEALNNTLSVQPIKPRTGPWPSNASTSDASEIKEERKYRFVGLLVAGAKRWYDDMQKTATRVPEAFGSMMVMSLCMYPYKVQIKQFVKRDTKGTPEREPVDLSLWKLAAVLIDEHCRPRNKIGPALRNTYSTTGGTTPPPRPPPTAAAASKGTGGMTSLWE